MYEFEVQVLEVQVLEVQVLEVQALEVQALEVQALEVQVRVAQALEVQVKVEEYRSVQGVQVDQPDTVLGRVDKDWESVFLWKTCILYRRPMTQLLVQSGKIRE